jgi:uncharacterized protein (DUF4415 family)
MRKEDNFSKGKRRPAIPPDPNKVRITIRLDADIVEYFKEKVHKAGGGNYQTMINSALRQHLDKKQEPMNEETLRRVIREELRAVQ